MKISLIACGGTIDKVYGSGKGIYDLHIGDPFAFDFLPKMFGEDMFPHRLSVRKKDSLDMNDEDRIAIAGACEQADTDLIIVTHGTDTMIDTARVISEWNLGRSRSIVLTGSLQPAAMKDSDAEFNLGLAVGAILTRSLGIHIAMHGIHTWDQCEKDAVTGRFTRI